MACTSVHNFINPEYIPVTRLYTLSQSETQTPFYLWRIEKSSWKKNDFFIFIIYKLVNNWASPGSRRESGGDVNSSPGHDVKSDPATSPVRSHYDYALLMYKL